MRFFITGTAGFIGFHLAQRLLSAGHSVVGVDGLTPYYDVNLKGKRNALLQQSERFQGFVQMLEDADSLAKLCAEAAPDVIVHLAAQAGVRYSLENPRAYVNANLIGTHNVLEAARTAGVKHLLIASTSSVYGANAKMPFVETDRADHPLTLYAASKKAAEDMAHSYAHLWSIPTTVLRIFTVYGPWGRPDMALFKFVRAPLAGQPIEVYGHGRQKRDFTYIDDLVEAVVRLIDCVPRKGEAHCEIDSLSPSAPYRVVNIGSGRPVGLLEFIDAIENALGVPIRRRMVEMQKGDVPATWASPELLAALTGYIPGSSLQTGVRAFVEWYRNVYVEPASV